MASRPAHTDEMHSLNRELYTAVMKADRDRVIQLCRQIPAGPSHILTIHNDTVLQMAIYSKKYNLVLDLLEMLADDHIQNMTLQNEKGNTILHEAATSDDMVEAAMKMLRKEPKLLDMRNRLGETALFRAAGYGKMKMYKFLDGEIDKIIACEREEEVEQVERRAFHLRDDKKTTLHISILTEHFDVAVLIAKKHEYLVSAQDGDGMTALQLLACNPSVFNSRYKKKCLDPRIRSFESYCGVPSWKAINEKKKRYESAVILAEFLIKDDTSWQATESSINLNQPKTHLYGAAAAATSQLGQKTATGEEQSKKVQVPATPLFLATKSGSLEIVEKILATYPQAAEYIDDEGNNILHVAIKYRQIHIFNYLEKLDTIPIRRLTRKINNYGDSILHMVAQKPGVHAGHPDLRSPATRLQEDLHFFERVKKMSKAHFTKNVDNKQQTAKQSFANENAQLRTEAKEWLKRTAENSSIVAVLIATVAFAAAYTVPGGPNQNTGYPILQNKSFFVIFTIADGLSLTLSLTSVITFLSILTSSFRLKDFKQSLPQKLMVGFTLLILSVSMMMVAFAATVILLGNSKVQWTRIALYSVAFLPVSIFLLSYLPLYTELSKTLKYSLKKIGRDIPRFNCANLFSSGRKTESLMPSNIFLQSSTHPTDYPV